MWYIKSMRDSITGEKWGRPNAIYVSPPNLLLTLCDIETNEEREIYYSEISEYDVYGCIKDEIWFPSKYDIMGFGLTKPDRVVLHTDTFEFASRRFTSHESDSLFTMSIREQIRLIKDDVYRWGIYGYNGVVLTARILGETGVDLSPYNRIILSDSIINSTSFIITDKERFMRLYTKLLVLGG